jgi:hypothetical protein
MTIEGIMTKSVNYYIMDNNNQMKSEVIKKGRDLMERLTLKSNSTIATPMLDSVK